MCFPARAVQVSKTWFAPSSTALCNGTTTAPQRHHSSAAASPPLSARNRTHFVHSQRESRWRVPHLRRQLAGWLGAGSNRRRKRPCKRPLRMCAWHRMRSLATPDAPRLRPSDLHWRAPCLRMPSIESQPSCRRPSAAADSLAAADSPSTCCPTHPSAPSLSGRRCMPPPLPRSLPYRLSNALPPSGVPSALLPAPVTPRLPIESPGTRAGIRASASR